MAESKNPSKHFLPVILIIILGFAVYGNSLNGKFIWADNALVKDNAYIKDFSRYVQNLFTEDIGSGSGIMSKSYRPLQMLTYCLDYCLWKLDARGYHLTNILLHISVALAIYWLINILYNHLFLAFLTSALFLVHPVHSEAITYISGRADALSSLFLLLCIIFYIKGTDTKKIVFYLVGLFSFILALLSRESSLILPVLLILFHYAFKKRLRIKMFLPILGVGVIYILLRLTVLSYLLPDGSSAENIFTRLPGFLVAITNYTRLLLLPFNLHMQYGDKVFNLTNFQAMLGLVILLSYLIYALRKRNQNQLLFFSTSWLFIALLPQSNLYPINAYMAEHWLYLPSIGFFLILSKGLTSLYVAKNRKILVMVLIIGLLTFYSFLTIKQNNYWREPIIFFERTLSFVPDSPEMHNNLGIAYAEADRQQEAIASYKKAIELAADHAMAYFNLGNAYSSLDRKQEAIASYKRAIELNPGYAKAYYNLAALYHEQRDYELANDYYRKARELGHKVHLEVLEVLNDYLL
jgi:tetratricopeptide (TPR) repeat protein